MKKILKLMIIILSAILVKLVLTFTINKIIIWNYNNNHYSTILIKILYPLNFNEPYIVYYNNGNILYKKEKYTEAIEKYKKAIEKHPPKKRVCDVRINLSLSMIKEIDEKFDYKKAYDQLEEAKNNLYNDNCASPTDNSGDSKDAEQLEEEIQELQNQLNSSSQSQDPQDKDEKDEEQEQEEDYEEIEEELKKNEKEANRSRQDDQSKQENTGKGYYSGKRW